MKLQQTSAKQTILIVGLPLLIVLLMGVFPLFTLLWGKTWGYLAALSTYWFIVCLPLSIYVIGPQSLFALYKPARPVSPRTTTLHALLLAFPVALTFVVAFLPKVGIVGAGVLVLAAVFALINGIVEELLWRGAFTHVFPQRIHLAYFFATLLFAAWHIAMALAQGVQYEGGAASLIGGALLLGMIWGFVAWRTKSIGLVTISHVLTNLFAFTGLIHDNYFT